MKVTKKEIDSLTRELAARVEAYAAKSNNPTQAAIAYLTREIATLQAQVQCLAATKERR